MMLTFKLLPLTGISKLAWIMAHAEFPAANNIEYEPMRDICPSLCDALVGLHCAF